MAAGSAKGGKIKQGVSKSCMTQLGSAPSILPDLEVEGAVDTILLRTEDAGKMVGHPAVPLLRASLLMLVMLLAAAWLVQGLQASLGAEQLLAMLLAEAGYIPE
jgi:hypothetical protein